ncbi:MAG: T9SS type A sorting domain-containing protein [Bacteroidia bacterium]
MNKSTLALQLFLIIPVFTFSQITLDQSYLPAAGDTFHFNIDLFTDLLPKDSVILEPQFWDFASELKNQANSNWAFTTPSANPYGNYFPDATVAVHLEMDSVHLFFRTDSQGLHAVGLYSLNSLFTGPIESNPHELYYPASFTLGDTVKRLSGAEIETTIGIPVQVIRSVEKVFTGIGFGNLLTPEALFQNVLLVKTETHTIDSAFAQFGPVVLFVDRQVEHTVNFDWLRNGTPALLLNILADSSGREPIRASYTAHFADHARYPQISYISDSSLCSGDILEIGISDTSGSHADNIYVIQLSTLANDFRNPLTLQTVEANSDTLVKVVIPEDINWNTSMPYLVRVISGIPERIGPTSPQMLSLTSFPDAVTSPDKTICKGDTVTLLAGGGQNYYWSPATGLDDRYRYNPRAFPEQTTLYTLIAGNACGLDFDSVLITVDPLPVTSSISGPPKAQAGQTATYTVANHPKTSYTWTVTGGQQISGGSTNTAGIRWDQTSSGKVEVIETDSNGCTSEKQSLNVQVETGIPESERPAVIRIYPNPADDMLNLDIPARSHSAISIELVDITGRVVVAHEKLRPRGEAFTMQLSLAGIPAGIYHLKLMGNGEISVHTVVVQE